jgi:prepilin-type N-terminal cleavage/methylation domain-containing protein
MMKVIKNDKGFTLTEIMVVVLLLAILSAIAIPQYSKTVEKQKAVEALHLLAVIGQAQERYYVINEVYTKEYSDLDADLIDLSTKKAAEGDTFKNRAFGFKLNGTADDDGKVTAKRNGGSYYFIREYKTGEVCCKSNDDDDCELFGFGDDQKCS